MARQGWDFVDSTIKTRHKVGLIALAREAYSTWLTSKGSHEALKQLVQRHTPRKTGVKQDGVEASNSPTTAVIPLTGPNSSTNQAPQPNAPTLRPPDVVRGASKTPLDTSKPASDAMLDLFERDRKLRPLKLNHATPTEPKLAVSSRLLFDNF